MNTVAAPLPTITMPLIGTHSIGGAAWPEPADPSTVPALVPLSQGPVASPDIRLQIWARQLASEPCCFGMEPCETKSLALAPMPASLAKYNEDSLALRALESDSLRLV